MLDVEFQQLVSHRKLHDAADVLAAAAATDVAEAAAARTAWLRLVSSC
jgi:Zn-dependent membrane protease YugP